MRHRQAFREHPLDAAMLYFHPASGTHVRVQNDATRALRRQAPRVAMFGITNHCNLACGFCSRDVTRTSAWTVASATTVLQGLAAAGTLEVAFGGGEPFAFRGFHELVAELARTTPLALNVTTNGTLLRAATFGAFADHLSQVRVSIYADTPWRAGCRVLAGHGQRWGANLIVDDAALPGLPALLADLVALGCHDVSLLSYVGPDRRQHLSPAGRVRLAALVADSPLACRLSVCFGDRVAVPRLFDGMDDTGDCGAGLDFVSITPDQRMQGCSFHDGGLPATSAQEILHGWRTARDRLGAPSARDGCARRELRLHRPAAVPRQAPPPVAVWQAFSGNNSGECVMVAKFDDVADANDYLAQLLPDWLPDEDMPPAWLSLFAEKRVGTAAALSSRQTPRELLAIGRSVIAVGYDADDMLRELRALAWHEGAHVVPDGIHLHDSLNLLAAARAADGPDAQALAEHWAGHPAARAWRHGDVVLVRLKLQDGDPGEPSTLAQARDLLVAWARHRPLAAEVLPEGVDDAALLQVKKHLADEVAGTPRLALRFWGTHGDAHAARFAQRVSEGTATVAGGCVLVTGLARRKRLAVMAFRQGAYVSALDGHEVSVHAYLPLPRPPRTKGKPAPALPEVDLAALRETLQACLPRTAHVCLRAAASWQDGPSLQIRTSDPAGVLAALVQVAQGLGAGLQAGLSEVDPVALAMRRVMAEVRG
jgi:MoaA/NifB/PqqE/SkfB family radical SAM enzyme